MSVEKIRITRLLKCIHRSNITIYKLRKSYILLSLAFNIFLGALPILSTITMQLLLNTIQSGPFVLREIIELTIIYVSIEILLVVGNLSYGYISNKNLQIINKKIQLSIIEKAGNLRLEDFENPETHNLMSRAQNGAASVTSFITGSFSFLRVLVASLSSLVILSKYNAYLVFAILVAPTFEYIFIYRMSRLQYIARKRRTTKERVLWYLGHIIKTGVAIKELKVFRLLDYWSNKVNEISSEIIEEDISIAKKSCVGQIALGIGEILISGVVFYLIVLDGLNGKILLGDVITYNKLIFGVKANVESIFALVEKMLKDALEVSNYYDLLEIERAQNGTKKIDKIDSIQFKDVSFKYQNSEKYVLRNVCLEIHPGETIALVGENGSGKSTLLKLILGFYNDYSGAILINGCELRSLDKEAYYTLVGCIFQDYMKYESTVRENVVCSNVRNRLNNEQIVNALINAGFDRENSKVFTLDNMLGTWFDDSVQLSGGEWQRIALSRALFKHAELYILDEPGASLDPNIETEILKKCQKLTKEKIGIISSHNIGKIGKYTNRIIVMKQGELAEDGTHEQLMELKGVYYNLYTSYLSG